MPHLASKPSQARLGHAATGGVGPTALAVDTGAAVAHHPNPPSHRMVVVRRGFIVFGFACPFEVSVDTSRSASASVMKRPSMTLT